MKTLVDLQKSTWFDLFRFLFSFRRHPLHKRENYRPFFIIGSGRSGNTLLRRILYSHPQIYIPPETYVLGKVITLFGRYRIMHWKDLVHLVLAAFEYHPEFKTFELSLRPLATQLLDTPKADRSLAYLLNAFYRFVAASHGKPEARWGDKTPMNTFHLEKLLSVFPDAQFIHIIRDGCDVAVSYYKAGLYNDVLSAADRWLVSVKKARLFTQQHPKSVLEVRYEQLVTHPELVVKNICNFMNIEFHEEMLISHLDAASMGDVPLHSHHQQTMKPISTSNIGKGRQQLTEDEKQLMQKKIGKYLHQLGYPPCVEQAEDTP